MPVPSDNVQATGVALTCSADTPEVLVCPAPSSVHAPETGQSERMHEDPLDPRLLTLNGRLYSSQQCAALLGTLISDIDWQYDYYAFGRRFDVPRLQAWYADEGVHYRYSDTMLEHRSWITPLLSIKQDVEHRTGHRFNSVLVTCYRDGSDHVTLHADDEAELGEAPVIASLSLGATRAFLYRHKQNHETRRMLLQDGELLIMQPAFQRDWTHCVPVEPGVTAPRINLTFRKVYL